jgi:hypothetical protein
MIPCPQSGPYNSTNYTSSAPIGNTQYYTDLSNFNTSSQSGTYPSDNNASSTQGRHVLDLPWDPLYDD